MVMTILEGRVTKENWAALEQSFREAVQSEEPGMEQSFLTQNSRDPDVWRILSVWSSREALDLMRRSTNTPRGVLIFREAGSVPELSIYDVRQQFSLK